MRIEPLFKENYLTFVKNSVGANTYRNLYARVDGKKKDILKDGELSCAFFVSSVLMTFFGLTDGIHATVQGTERDLLKSGWYTIEKPRPGAVLVWRELFFDKSGEPHHHIGFYTGSGRAVSFSDTSKSPVLHHWTFGKNTGKPTRAVEAIYWNKKIT